VIKSVDISNTVLKSDGFDYSSRKGVFTDLLLRFFYKSVTMGNEIEIK